MRKIIHIDMDAFFASVEQRDHIEYRNQPLIIGGSPEKRGVVSTCSYEARVFGVHSAMPTLTAHRLCPKGIFIEGDMKKYARASSQVFKIFYEFTDKVEPMSIDEAFLDVTDSLPENMSATQLAGTIQKEIFLRTNLTASAGVSYNKFLAKVASGLKKPAGLSVIKPSGAIRFLEALPIEKFHGIGKVTAKKLMSMNIRYGRDLKKLDQKTLVNHFGKAGLYYFNIVRGIDERSVETEYTRKSYGREVTLEHDICDLQKIRIIIRRLSLKVAKMSRLCGVARTVTLKIRYSGFQTVTRSFSCQGGFTDGVELGEAAVNLLLKTEAATRPVRLIGVAVSNFNEAKILPELDFEQLLLPF